MCFHFKSSSRLNRNKSQQSFKSFCNIPLLLLVHAYIFSVRIKHYSCLYIFCQNQQFSCFYIFCQNQQFSCLYIFSVRINIIHVFIFSVRINIIHSYVFYVRIRIREGVVQRILTTEDRHDRRETLCLV